MTVFTNGLTKTITPAIRIPMGNGFARLGAIITSSIFGYGEANAQVCPIVVGIQAVHKHHP